jgi:hypothetical protein
MVERIIYAPSIPDYPETSENGVAYIVNLTGVSEESQKDHKNMVMHFEYIINTFLIYYRYNIRLPLNGRSILLQ